MKWFSSRPAEPSPEGAEAALIDEVRKAMPDADTETVRIVAASAGLLGHVAYADRDFSPTEQQRVHQLLLQVNGISKAGADAILSLLSDHVLEISTIQAPRFARALMDLADRDLRYEILRLLVEVAAADGEVSGPEVRLLRQLTTSLGLTQQDYNELQEEHRDKLEALKSS